MSSHTKWLQFCFRHPWTERVVTQLLVCPSPQLKIWAQPSQLHTAEYAANVTKIIFDYFEEYFNMSYSISKLGRWFHVKNRRLHGDRE